jgi:hypothetical protein
LSRHEPAITGRAGLLYRSKEVISGDEVGRQKRKPQSKAGPFVGPPVPARHGTWDIALCAAVDALDSFGLLAVTTLDMIALAFLVGG